MKVALQFTAHEEKKALHILLRHSPGIILQKRIYIVSGEAAQALTAAGIRFKALASEAFPPESEGVIAGERI